MPLYVQSLGDPGAPAILFLHGGGISGWMWAPVVERLPEYHALIPDLPQHGKSAAERPFTMEAAAGRMSDLIRTRVPAGRAHVVGLSLGAQLTVQMLSAAPEVVDHAIVSGTLVRPLPGMRSTGLLNLIARMYMPFRNVDWLVRANLKSNGIPGEYLDRFREDTRTLNADSFSHIMSENAKFRIPEGVANVQTPTLVLVGERELRIMRDSARDLASTLPRSEAFSVRNLGHSWVLEAPDLAAQIIRAWLNDEPLPEGSLEQIKKNGART